MKPVRQMAVQVPENRWYSIFSGQCHQLTGFPVTECPENIGFGTAENISHSSKIQICLAAVQAAEQIKINLNKFPIGLGHIIINENIGDNGDSDGAAIM